MIFRTRKINLIYGAGLVTLSSVILYFFIWQDIKLLEVGKNDINYNYKIGSGKIIVLDSANNVRIDEVDLSTQEEGYRIQFNPHDFELSRNRKYVWVSATAEKEQFLMMARELAKKFNKDYHVAMATDQIIIIDTTSNSITRRIEVGVELGLTDIVFSPDYKFIYVAAEKGSAVYKIDTNNYDLELIQLPPESSPHLLGFAKDSSNLLALSKNENMIFEISLSGEVKKLDTMSLNEIEWSSH